MTSPPPNEDPKTSICTDCSTVIIGDLLRCGACSEQQARRIRRDGLPAILARGVVAIELLVIIAIGLIFAVRGCAS